MSSREKLLVVRARCSRSREAVAPRCSLRIATRCVCGLRGLICRFLSSNTCIDGDGTTVVRALESSVDENGDAIASRGWTDLVITPQRGVRVVDGLLTGLHEPRASHLSMLEAIAGRDAIEKAYALALDREYLWHEFGELHLIA